MDAAECLWPHLTGISQQAQTGWSRTKLPRGWEVGLGTNFEEPEPSPGAMSLSTYLIWDNLVRGSAKESYLGIYVHSTVLVKFETKFP
jgi:hypothetical protein